MPTGTIIGATRVMGGNNVLVATSVTGNYENNQIDLVFANPAAFARILRGANYTLIDAGGTRYSCVVSSIEPASNMVHFGVSG